ncbi:haloacid dehalogenase-like hydrolase [soil metagenome]
MSTFVLWDIDGTLILNRPSAGAIYLDSIEAVTGVRPTARVAHPHGMTEGQLVRAILEVNDLSADALGDVMKRIDVLAKEEHESGLPREAAPGAHAALGAVTARGWTNGLLTGNGPLRAKYKLQAAGIDPDLFDPTHSYFGHESPTRHDLTAGARAALGGRHAVIVGDTPADGAAADSAGIPFLAVATGIYSEAELADTSALVVVTDLVIGLDELIETIAQSMGTASARR